MTFAREHEDEFSPARHSFRLPRDGCPCSLNYRRFCLARRPRRFLPFTHLSNRDDRNGHGLSVLEQCSALAVLAGNISAVTGKEHGLFLFRVPGVEHSFGCLEPVRSRTNYYATHMRLHRRTLTPPYSDQSTRLSRGVFLFDTRSSVGSSQFAIDTPKSSV